MLADERYRATLFDCPHKMEPGRGIEVPHPRELSELQHRLTDGDGTCNYTDIYWRYALYILYLNLRLLYNCGRFILWLCTGVLFRRFVNRQSYVTSAHVLRVVARYKFDVMYSASSPEDFLLRHEDFTHPEYVMQDNVSIYQVCQDQVLFVEVPSHLGLMWQKPYGPFHRQALFENAIRVIVMPLTSFLQLGDKLGDSPSKLIFIHNTTRSGSTLLVRILEQTGRCVAYSEPDALNGVLKLVGDRYITDQFLAERLVRNTVRLLSKPIIAWGRNQPLAYCIKVTSLCIFEGPLLYKLFPQSPQLFLYRHFRDVGRSMGTAVEVLPALKLAYLLVSLSPYAATYTARQVGGPSFFFRNLNFCFSGNNLDELGIAVCATTTRVYFTMRRNGMNISAARYEDIVDDPIFALSAIFQYFQLPLSLLELGIKAMAFDSHSGSILSVQNLNKHRRSNRLTYESEKIMNRFCVLYGVPHWNRQCVLPGTITRRHQQYDPLLLSDRQVDDLVRQSKIHDNVILRNVNTRSS